LRSCNAASDYHGRIFTFGHGKATATRGRISIPGGKTLNQGGLNIRLKPRSERPPIDEVIAELRRKLAAIPGLNVYLQNRPVITIGGFNGGDPSPTLEQFQQLVAEGQVRYLLVSGQGAGGGAGSGAGGAGGGGGGPGGQGTSSAITSWAAQVGTTVNVGGSSNAAVYDLSGAASS
jgi:hypothetical protein